MKKYIYLTLFLLFGITSSTFAQGVVASELEAYALNRYSSDWSISATSIFSKNPLIDGTVQYSEVIDVPGKTQDELYQSIRKWMVSTFGTLKEDSPAKGRLITTDAVKNISERVVGIRNAYRLNINPDVRVDVRDGRVRLTCVTSYYDVDKTGGLTGKALKGVFGKNKLSDNEVWMIKDYFPFTSFKEAHCAQAYVMTFCYGPVLAQKFKMHALGLTSSDSEW